MELILAGLVKHSSLRIPLLKQDFIFSCKFAALTFYPILKVFYSSFWWSRTQTLARNYADTELSQACMLPLYYDPWDFGGEDSHSQDSSLLDIGEDYV